MPTNRTAFGLSLEKPSSQTVLPVIGKPSGRLYGYFSIAKTTFNGDETSFTMPDGDVPVTTVTHPTFGTILSGRQNISRTALPVVGQYMAACWSDAELIRANRAHTYPEGVQYIPWSGFSNFIDISYTGYSHEWIQALNGYEDRLVLSALFSSLTKGMDATAQGYDPDPSVPPTPDNPNATMQWYANVTGTALVGECPYFDFNWVTLFQSKNQMYNNSTAVIPQSITPTTVPAGFKVFLVNSPTVVPGTNVTYDTLRVMLLDAAQAPAGTYVFEFDVTTDQGSAPVTLTVTITAN